MARPLWIGLTLAVAIFISACGSDKFDDGAARATLDSSKVHVESEQVSITPDQVSCGANHDLWSAPEMVGQRSVARLLPKGRELQFTDDVSMDDPGYSHPYTQIRGDFNLTILDSSVDIKDTSDQAVKRIESHVAVRIQHDCFASPLPLMGIRHGQYAEGAPITLEFAFRENGWQTQLVR